MKNLCSKPHMRTRPGIQCPLKSDVRCDVTNHKLLVDCGCRSCPYVNWLYIDPSDGFGRRIGYNFHRFRKDSMGAEV